MRRIFLIAGHNGKGTGANGIIDEGSETIVLRDFIDIELCRLGVIPETDFNMEDDKLKDVVKYLKNEVNERDICIDIHFNAGNSDASGTEVLIPNDYTDFEKSMADELSYEISSVLCIKNRGTKTESNSAHKKLAMLSGFDCQQILIEVCFCTNDNDVSKYIENKDKLVRIVAKIIEKYAKV